MNIINKIVEKYGVTTHEEYHFSKTSDGRKVRIWRSGTALIIRLFLTDCLVKLHFSEDQFMPYDVVYKFIESNNRAVKLDFRIDTEKYQLRKELDKLVNL